MFQIKPSLLQIILIALNSLNLGLLLGHLLTLWQVQSKDRDDERERKEMTKARIEIKLSFKYCCRFSLCTIDELYGWGKDSA